METTVNVWLDLIQHRRCIEPHVDAKSACLELMLQPLPRLIPLFEGPCSLSLQFILGLSGLTLNPATSHCSACVLYPFLWHDLAIGIFFLRSPSRGVCPVLFRISSFVTSFVTRWYRVSLANDRSLLRSFCKFHGRWQAIQGRWFRYQSKVRVQVFWWKHLPHPYSIHAKFADISLELDCDLEAPKSEDFRLIVHVIRPTATMTEARGLAYVEEAWRHRQHVLYVEWHPWLVLLCNRHAKSSLSANFYTKTSQLVHMQHNR